MPDGADMRDRTPSGSRYLMLATLVVWALVVFAALTLTAGGDIGPLVWIIVLLVPALVIVAAAMFITVHPVIGTLTVACTVLAVLFALFFLGNTLNRFDPGPPLARSSWESEVGIGAQVEDPALVRRVHEAAGASEDVAVEVTVFDEGGGRRAADVRIQADDVLTYLAALRNHPISKTLERSKIRAWFIEVEDEDGDDVYQSSWDGGLYAGWARRDIYECFFTTSLVHGPPCPF